MDLTAEVKLMDFIEHFILSQVSFKIICSLFSKVGCVFPMVIWPEFPMGQYTRDDYQELAPYINAKISYKIKIMILLTNHFLFHRQNLKNQNNLNYEIILQKIVWNYLKSTESSFRRVLIRKKVY